MKFKPRATRITIIIVLMIMAVVGYYAFLSGRAKERNAEANMTAVEAALSRNLDKDYPPTPKEVMKYYNEIMKCYYADDTSEDDIEALKATRMQSVKLQTREWLQVPMWTTTRGTVIPLRDFFAHTMLMRTEPAKRRGSFIF